MSAKTLYAALLLAITSPAIAQPVLTAATNSLQAGFSNVLHYTNSYSNNPGPSGPGQVWDFSGFTALYSTGNTFTACAATPYCSQFPGSDIAGHDSIAYGSNPPQEEYTYYVSGNNAISIAGELTPGGSFVYSQAEVMLTFPFTYLSSFRTTYSYADASSPGHYTVGLDSVTGDGYGTIKTPAGTFNNVLRVKTVRTFYDSSASGKVQNERDYFYRWYSQQLRDYVFILQDYEPAGGAGLTIGYTVQPPLEVQNTGGLEASLQISPNPATERLSLACSLSNSGKVTVLLTDMQGRQVLRSLLDGTSGRNNLPINVAGLPKGIYMLQISADGNRVVRKVEII